MKPEDHGAQEPATSTRAISGLAVLKMVTVDIVYK